MPEGATHASAKHVWTFNGIDNAPSTSIAQYLVFHPVATSPASAPSKRGVFRHLWQLRFRHSRKSLLRRQLSCSSLSSRLCLLSLWRGRATCSSPDNSVNNWWERGHEVSVSAEYRVGCEKRDFLSCCDKLQRDAGYAHLLIQSPHLAALLFPMPLRISHLASRISQPTTYIIIHVRISPAPAQFSGVGEAMKAGVASLYRVTAMTKSMGRAFYNPSVTFINARR